jgi:hypothetical protein
MSKSSGLFCGMLVLLLAVVVGCTSYPQARYYKAGGVDPTKKGDVQGKISFTLQGGLVTITKPTQEKPPAQEKPQAQSKTPQEALGLTNRTDVECSKSELKSTQAFATQADAANSQYILVPEKTTFTKSNVSVTYFDGTHRIKTIGTELQDDRIKIIGAIGSAISTIVPLAMAAEEGRKPSKLELPYVFDFTDPGKFKLRDEFTQWETMPGYNCFYRYKVSKPQGNVSPAEDFFKNQDFTREFPVSACVDLTLEIGKHESTPPSSTPPEVGESVMSYTVRVPDPSYVDPVPFPIKGTITTHSVCGADISTQPSQSVSAFETLEAVAKQVESIYKAAQKKTTTEQPKTPGK